MRMGPGRVRLDVRKHHQRVVGKGQAPQGNGHGPKLTEFKESG